MWIYRSTKISWPPDCKELILEDINFQTKNFFLFDNPSLSDDLPYSFEKFDDFEKTISGKKIGNFFYPLADTILIDKNMKLRKSSNLVLNEGQKIIIKNKSTFVILGNIEINGSTDSKVKILGQEPGYGSVISYNNFFKAKKFRY